MYASCCSQDQIKIVMTEGLLTPRRTHQIQNILTEINEVVDEEIKTVVKRIDEDAKRIEVLENELMTERIRGNGLVNAVISLRDKVSALENNLLAERERNDKTVEALDYYRSLTDEIIKQLGWKRV